MSPSTPTITPDPPAGAVPEQPDPPRFRSLKRGMFIGLVVCALLCGVRWWWGWEAQRCVDREVAAAHARGEGLLVTDFVTPPVPPEENAATTLLAAAAAIRFTPEQTAWQQNSPITTSDLQMMISIADANRPARALARKARQQDRVDWGIQFLHPVLNAGGTPLNSINSMRSLANFLDYCVCGGAGFRQ